MAPVGALGSINQPDNAMAHTWDDISLQGRKSLDKLVRILQGLKRSFLVKGILAAAFGLILAIMLLHPARAQSSRTGSGVPCSAPMAVLKAFYDSNDAGRFDGSIKYVTDDVAFDTWATGVNGHIMVPRHLKGKQALRGFLARGRGLSRRLPDSPPDGPVYHETRIIVSGNHVQFMLEPDRIRPNGRLYNPFSIEAILDGCRIKSLTVIEQITWL
jgi:hypothetical protein